ncbi:MAG: tRNA (guanine(10)-N(2))-dimethyltransferase, partial [Candidatus Nanohaloarchaea archaeon]
MEERGVKIFAADKEDPDKDEEVFYNRKMLINRDLSEIAAKTFKSKINTGKLRVADATAGSGVRGLRYADIAKELHFNDPNPRARESIKKALAENDVDAEIHGEDANVFLSQYRNFFQLIDIDPFGSFTDFLDSTARAANHTSFVGLTATDNAAPAGSYPKVCERRYSSTPLKNSFMHETGLRIYLKTVFENFARFDKAFDPKICWHERHYTRISGRVTESKQRCNQALENIGYLSFCPECRWRKLKRKQQCGNCGNTDLKHAGPLWTGKFVDQRFTEEMLERIPESWEDSRELLEKIHAEAEIITPFYDLHKLCSNMEISSPKRDPVIKTIQEKGYPVARTHFTPTGFRTDAP